MIFHKLGITSDHAGFPLKEMILGHLKAKKIEVLDFGTFSETISVDYPDYAKILAKEVSLGKLDGGIAICGSGIGISIACNKIARIRATVVWDEYTSRMSRMHNNSNILCLGGRTLNHHRALDLVDIWLSTPFEGARHQARLDKIALLESTPI